MADPPRRSTVDALLGAPTLLIVAEDGLAGGIMRSRRAGWPTLHVNGRRANFASLLAASGCSRFQPLFAFPTTDSPVSSVRLPLFQPPGVFPAALPTNT